MKVPRGMSKFIRDRYVWYIAILLGIIVIFTFIVEQVLFGKTLEESEWHPVYMTIRNFMFLGVVLLSAWRFGFKGGLAVGLAIGLIELPHVVTVMSVGERRIDNLTEFAVFAPVGVLIAWLVGVRKQEEKRLVESEEKFRSVAEYSPNMIFINKAGRIVYASHKCEEITGYKREELYASGFDFMTLIALKDREQVMANFRRHMASEEIPPYDYSLITREGRQLEVILSTRLINYEGGKAIVGIITDISERKQAEKALIYAAEEWRTTFDSVTDMVSIINRDSTIVRANKAFADAFKTPLNEVVGKHCYEVVHSGGKRPSWCVFARMLETGKHERAETFEPHLGSYLEISASPMRNDKGKIVGCVHTVGDITERKKVQEQLMAQDRLASIGQLVSGVAHEINNPLTSVIGFSDMLLQRDLPDDVKADLKIVHDEANRTGRIVRNLLTFVRKQPEEKIPVDINEVIVVVLNLRTHEQTISNIQMNSRFAPDLPQIMGDSSQLQQVFFNLIVNAEQAMLEAHNRGTLTITTERAGNIVKARFTDDGPGISPENMNRLFTPFFTTKEVGKGTGLGLSICHGIITEHGGRIYAESEFGKGATFIVELPIIPKQVTTEESAG